MTTLLEVIQGRQGQPDAAAQQEQLRKLLGAKAGVVAAPATGPAASSLAGEQAITGAREQVGQIQQAARLEARGLEQAGAEQRVAAGEARAGLGLARREIQQNLQLQEQAILGDLSRAGRELDYQKDRVRAEQLGFTLGLQDKKYLSDIEIEAKKQNLTNELAFRESLQVSIFRDQQDLLQGKYEMNKILDADDREFMTMMGDMDINFAMDLAQAEAAAASKAQLFTAVGGLAGAGAQGWGAYETSQAEAERENLATRERQEASPGFVGPPSQIKK